MKKIIFLKKSVSPLIAIVLLIVVTVMLFSIFSIWGKSFTTKKLDSHTTFGDLKTSDAQYYIYPNTFSNGLMRFNYDPPRNLGTKEIIIGRYKIITDNNETVDVTLDTNYTLVKGLNNVNLAGFSGLDVLDHKMNIQLITTDNRYIMLKNITNPYMIKIKTLVANPVAGIYPSSQSVTLSSSTSDASIYYTTDGSTPTEASTLYEGAISISETTTLKAKAFKTNWADSDVFVAEYIIEVALEQVATPTSDPEPNSLITNVSLDCVTNDAIIYYTIDGSIPTRSSNIYISDIILSVDSNTTINAFAIKDGYDDSDMFSGWFISPDNSCSPFI